MACFPLSSLGEEESNGFRVGGVKKGETRSQTNSSFSQLWTKEKTLHRCPRKKRKEMWPCERNSSPKLNRIAELLLVPFPGNLKVHRQHQPVLPLLLACQKGCACRSAAWEREMLSLGFATQCGANGQGSRQGKEACERTQFILFSRLLWETRMP